jgi:hypothetical protein
VAAEVLAEQLDFDVATAAETPLARQAAAISGVHCAAICAVHAVDLRTAAVRALAFESSQADEWDTHEPAATKASAGRASRKNFIAHLQKVMVASRTDTR